MPDRHGLQRWYQVGAAHHQKEVRYGAIDVILYMNAISDCVDDAGRGGLFGRRGINDDSEAIAHIRHKETDRIHALAVELRRARGRRRGVARSG